MPIDLQSFTRSRNADVTGVTMPSISVGCVVKDSQSQVTLLDLTGANKVTFPQDVAGYSAAEKQSLLEHIMRYMLGKRIADAGIVPSGSIIG